MLIQLNHNDTGFLLQWIDATIRELHRMAKDLDAYKASQVIIGRDLTGGDDATFLKEITDNAMQLQGIREKLVEEVGV